MMTSSSNCMGRIKSPALLKMEEQLQIWTNFCQQYCNVTNLWPWQTWQVNYTKARGFNRARVWSFVTVSFLISAIKKFSFLWRQLTHIWQSDLPFWETWTFTIMSCKIPNLIRKARFYTEKFHRDMRWSDCIACLPFCIESHHPCPLHRLWYLVSHT